MIHLRQETYYSVKFFSYFSDTVLFFLILFLLLFTDDHSVSQACSAKSGNKKHNNWRNYETCHLSGSSFQCKYCKYRNMRKIKYKLLFQRFYINFNRHSSLPTLVNLFHVWCGMCLTIFPWTATWNLPFLVSLFLKCYTQRILKINWYYRISHILKIQIANY